MSPRSSVHVVDVELDVLHQHAVVELLGVEPHRRQGRLAVGQGERERVADDALDGRDRLAPQPPGRDDAAERQGRARLGLPAAAEILDQLEAAGLPGEPALVDADAEVGGALRSAAA